MKFFRFIFILVAISALNSCAPAKNIAYFQDRLTDHPEEIDEHAGILIQPKDMLSIIVSSRTPELSAMFNLSSVTYQAGSEIFGNGAYQRVLGYVVDNDGCIEFPILGKIKVMGMTRWGLSEHIRNLLIKNNYLEDPVVTVEFMNFKVSVLGEVNAPGTYTIEGDKVTILQAISLARDLTIYGKRENVSVIREKDGARTIYEVNLCSTDIFNSPAYYLQQNDIVYVEPSKIKARQSTMDDKGMRTTSILLSSGSLLVSIATLIISILL